MLYEGIELELPQQKPSLTHSRAFDMIRGESSSQNMHWNVVISSIPWGRLKEICPDLYGEACCLFSMIQMDYQICNGGIDQYFYNGYHETFQSSNPDEAELYDLDEQKCTFSDYVKFAQEIFPDRTVENQALFMACKAFQALQFEEDAVCNDTIYCDEDEYIYDEELDKDVPNPNYFEPYDETYNEDVIHNADGFDDIFTNANDYLEEIFEIQSQLLCKQLGRELQDLQTAHADIVQPILNLLPDEAKKKPSLASLIEDAAARSHGGSEKAEQELEAPQKM